MLSICQEHGVNFGGKGHALVIQISAELGTLANWYWWKSGISEPCKYGWLKIPDNKGLVVQVLK